MDKEYIPREDVINDIGDLFTICRETYPNECGHHFIVEDELQIHLDHVRNLPPADVVEVVRCRDCIYWEPASPTRTSGNCNRSFDIPAWANDFCSYGKRKDGGQDDGI